jgi:hypothetical protein
MAPGLSLLIGTSMSADVLLPSAESRRLTGDPLVTDVAAVDTRDLERSSTANAAARAGYAGRDERGVRRYLQRSIARRTRPPSTRNERRRGRWRLAPVGPILPA